MGFVRHVAATVIASCAVHTVAQISTLEQNGVSTLGLLSAQPLPAFLSAPLVAGYPWGEATVVNTDPYDESKTPNTGVTRYYKWTISNITLAPDGVPVPILAVNHQFPGPLVEANWGDWIEVEVYNNLTEGTSIHWHGFLQQGTPYYDGSPGISQCPIAPGGTFTYRVRASLYGTSWWHGHFSSQYIQGLAGPIVVHGPQSTAYDIDLGPFMLTDWFHSYYKTLVHQIQVADPFGPILPPQAKNMLINGKANYPCGETNLTCTPNAGITKVYFQTGKKHLMRLINHGAEGVMFFSIDGYNFTVIANDFVPVKPYVTDLITLGIGQRTDIVVHATGKDTDSVAMRLTDGPPGNIPAGGIQPAGKGGCNIGDGIKYTTLGAIYYPKADTSKMPTTKTLISTSRYITPAGCNNDALTRTTPVFVMPVKEPDVTLRLTVTGGYNASGDFVWWMNNQTYLSDFNDPLLLEAKYGNTTFPASRVTYNFGNTVKTIRVVLNGVGFPAAHPMHIHGHNFQVLNSGFGEWDNKTIIRPSNPQRRDTQLMGPLGYIVVQWELNNPGVWPFHCHIAWHLSQGMNLNIVEMEKKLKQELKIPRVMQDTCRAWWKWTGSNVVDVIDSGL